MHCVIYFSLHFRQQPLTPNPYGVFMKPIIPLLFLCLPAIASAASPTINSNLGKGVLLYDRDAGAKDECIRFDPNKVVTEDARLTTYKLTQIKTKEELSDRIAMSVSSSGGYGTFSGSAKASFVREIEWNYNSNYILVEASRVTQRQVFAPDNAALKDESLNVLRDSKFRFLESCGNAFTTSVDLGGEIFGLIEIKANTYSEKQRIESSLSASGSFGAGHASGSADYERTIRKLSSTYNVKVEFRHIGGDQVDVPQTVDSLLDLSTRIETLSDNSPVTLALHTRDYSTVSNYLLDNNDPEVAVRQNGIDWANGKLKQARDLYAQALFILENPSKFDRFNETELKKNLTYMDEKIIELKNFVARSYSFLNRSDISTIQVNLDIRLPAVKARALRRGLGISCEVKPSEICGVVAPLLGTGPVCGTVYNLAAAPACGIKTYKAAAGPVCGVKSYQSCYHGHPSHWGGSRPHGRDPSCGVEEYNTCRDSSFGVEEYNACRDPQNGIEKYETCRHKDFGYEFDTCRHFSHGPDTYKSCEVSKIGNLETYCPKF
jgi:hypothetical protein